MRQNKFFQLLKINKFTVFFTVFLFLCIISAIVIKLGINVHGLAVFKNNISNFFNQSAVNKSSLLTKSFEQLWITIKYTATGTFIGFILGFLLGYLSSLRITNNFTAIFVKLGIIFLDRFLLLFLLTYLTLHLIQTYQR